MRASDAGAGTVLVVGAGLAGMTAAHHVAEWGAEVTLVDSAPYIGGAFLFLDHTFTTDTCGLCMALPRQPSTCPTLASESHPQITMLPGTTLTALEGEPGRFVATLRRGPRYVDPERCDSCGICAQVCPVTRAHHRWGRFLGNSENFRRGSPDPLRADELHSSSRDFHQDVPGNSVDPAGDLLRHYAPAHAIYAPPPQAVPHTYTIDRDACIGVDPGCQACVAACPQNAIDLGATGQVEEIDVGAVVLAPGFAPFDAAQAVEYGWGRCANVVTSLELERMLNRSGPTKGRILRPSDGRVPQRIAFVHCVGSRSEALGRPYCSSSCCMITAKQVGLSKEVVPDAELTVFTMDVRTTGKGYERYFQRVTGLPGVTYRRGRPAAVHELPGSKDLRLLTPEGEEMVDLLVLAVGMGPAEGVKELAETAGVAIDAYGFILTGEGGAGCTSRPGVFSVGYSVDPGSGAAPADIPETVTHATAAAAMAARVLTPAPGIDVSGVDTEATTETPSPSPTPEVGTGDEVGGRGEGSQAHSVSHQPPRIGLFLCSCHGDLDEQLDFAALAAAAEELRDVSYVDRIGGACDPSGLRAIERAAVEHDLNRFVIAGCSPHLYADRFESLMERLGLPQRLLARANIREGAAWVTGPRCLGDIGRRDDGAPHRPSTRHPQGDPAGATAMARGEIAMAVAALRETPDPGDWAKVPGRYRPSGRRRSTSPVDPFASLPSGRRRSFGVGKREGVVERVLVLGGGLAGMTAALTLAELGVGCDLVEREAVLGGELQEARHTLDGLDAQALLRRTVAQVEANEGVRLWTEAQLLGWSGTQGDFQAELQVRGEVQEEQYGALIVATGAEAATTNEYLYSRHPRVITQRELEHRIAASAKLDGVELRSVVMIQCVGSRNDEHPYCSRVCCGHAIKNALDLKKIDPDIEVSVLYRDIRTMGTRELYYREARRLGVRFLRYEPPQRPEVEAQGDRVRVTVHDTLYDETLTLDADMLVLSTGIVASPGNRRLAELLGVGLDEDGFFAEVHPKLRPVDLPKPGLFLCGMAYGPRFITESVGQARAAAMRAALSVVRPPEPRHDVVTVEPKLCSFCGLCVRACPYGARVLDYEERVAQVIDYLCKGCGACVALCPNGASRQPAFGLARSLAVVDAALD